MKPKRILVKIGGASLNDNSTLSALSELLWHCRREHTQVVLVHGGGPAINEELLRRGIQWQFINGQRQTTSEMMEVIDDVLFGKVNKEIADFLFSCDLPVVRFSGSGNRILECEAQSPELLQVGKVVAVHSSSLEIALNKGQIPLVAPLGFAETIEHNSEKFNINADWAATSLAVALKVDAVYFLTDQDGILDAEKKVLTKVSGEFLKSLIQEGIIYGGMMTKTQAMLFAQENGVSKVKIGKAAEGSKLLSIADLGSSLNSQADFTSAEVLHGHIV